MTSTFVCFLEAGDWVWPTANTTLLDRCCHACVHTRSCAVFELNETATEQCRLLCGGEGNRSSASSLSRGLVVRVAHREDSSSGDADALTSTRVRRRLRMNLRHKRRRSSGFTQLPSSCRERPPFSNATMAERCGMEHSARFVLSECGGGSTSGALAAAQANQLYLRAECGAACVYDPAMPTVAGWEYRPAERCYERWRQPADGRWDGSGGSSAARPPHRCMAALLDDPVELTRVLGRVSRSCADWRSCELPRSVGGAALRSSGCTGRHAAQRNVSLSCTAAAGTPAVSVDVVRSQASPHPFLTLSHPPLTLFSSPFLGLCSSPTLGRSSSPSVADPHRVRWRRSTACGTRASRCASTPRSRRPVQAGATTRRAGASARSIACPAPRRRQAMGCLTPPPPRLPRARHRSRSA